MADTDETIGETVSRLMASGREFVTAEKEKQKLRARLVGLAVRDIAILLSVAMVLLFGALITSMVGLLFALEPYFGVLGATATVIGGTFVIVMTLGLFARARFRKLTGAGR